MLKSITLYNCKCWCYFWIQFLKKSIMDLGFLLLLYFVFSNNICGNVFVLFSLNLPKISATPPFILTNAWTFRIFKLEKSNKQNSVFNKNCIFLFWLTFLWLGGKRAVKTQQMCMIRSTPSSYIYIQQFSFSCTQFH